MSTRSIAQKNHQLLELLFEDPQAMQKIQQLPVVVLIRVIQQIGLEDCGHILSMASSTQLEEIFDQDLWKNTMPGEEEVFDAERFGIWLEVLGEFDGSDLARHAANLDPVFLAAALSHHIFVLNTDELAAQFSETDPNDTPEKSDQNLVEKVLESELGYEFDQWWVFSRSEKHWNAVLELLSSLDRSYRSSFVRLMEDLERASQFWVEETGGLLKALSALEQLQDDVAFDREKRRSSAGFVEPRAARNFLKLAETETTESILQKDTEDPITQAYFRDYSAPAISENPDPRLKTINLLLRAAQSPDEREPTIPLLLRNELEILKKAQPALYERRHQELSYLANILMAGGLISGRRHRPAEAAERAMSVCETGISCIRKLHPSLSKESLVTEKYSLVQVFRVGWNNKQRL